jgi:hypothetical protein
MTVHARDGVRLYTSIYMPLEYARETMHAEAGMQECPPSHAPGSSWTGDLRTRRQPRAYDNGHGLMGMNRCHVLLPNFMVEQASCKQSYHKFVIYVYLNFKSIAN